MCLGLTWLCHWQGVGRRSPTWPCQVSALVGGAWGHIRTGSDSEGMRSEWKKWGCGNIKRLLHQRVIIARTGEIWNIWWLFYEITSYQNEKKKKLELKNSCAENEGKEQEWQRGILGPVLKNRMSVSVWRQSQLWHCNAATTILPGWQKFCDLCVADGRIAHLMCVFLWGGDADIKPDVNPSVPGHVSRWSSAANRAKKRT